MTSSKARGGVFRLCQRVVLVAAFAFFGAMGPATAQDEYDDEGDFIITETEEVTDDSLQELLSTLEDDSFLEDIVEGLNLPVDISIALKQCDEANAYFDPEETAITICLELFTETRDKFASF